MRALAAHPPPLRAALGGLFLLEHDGDPPALFGNFDGLQYAGARGDIAAQTIHPFAHESAVRHLVGGSVQHGSLLNFPPNIAGGPATREREPLVWIRNYAAARLSNNPRPSMPPTSGSIRFSGCGIS